MIRHRRRLPAALAVIWLLAGCATPEVAALRADAHGLPPQAEVAGVPFHPQQEQYCGPAALATVLGWSGLPARQDALASEVFTPGREARSVMTWSAPRAATAVLRCQSATCPRCSANWLPAIP
jgi:hypothetical protein